MCTRIQKRQIDSDKMTILTLFPFKDTRWNAQWKSNMDSNWWHICDFEPVFLDLNSRQCKTFPKQPFWSYFDCNVRLLYMFVQWIANYKVCSRALHKVIFILYFSRIIQPRGTSHSLALCGRLKMSLFTCSRSLSDYRTEAEYLWRDQFHIRLP